MDIQVLFVAPFDTLYKTAMQVIDERFAASKEHIQVIKGNLSESVPHVRQALEDGAQVVVSRGGTAKILAESVQVPVVSVQISVMDVIRMLAGRGKSYDRVGIAGFRNVIYGSEEIGDILGIRLLEYSIQGEEEAVRKLSAAKADGVRYIVGDAISVKVAKQLGMESELIDSGREAVFAALKEALLIAEIRREEQERSAMLRTVVDQSTDGIIAADAGGCITMMNAQAEKIFKVSYFDAIGRQAAEVFPVLRIENLQSKEGDFDDVREIHQKTFAVKCSPLRIQQEVIGRLFSLQNVSQLQKIERSVRKKLHQKGLVAKNHMQDIIGRSAACMEMKRKAAKYALTESTILVTGASGTGKEVLVQSIHNASARADGPFVAVNCAALPENLLESELFGYEEGAFTGARRGGRQGLFELAHGGTLFLDEIGEMPMALQSRLLRVLQEKEVMHIGGDSVIPVDVRIVAATNQPLMELVSQKKFREDLYYRLNLLRIHLPTLAERAEDIPLLAQSFLRKLQPLNPRISTINAKALEYLGRRPWPGNIRQLGNVVERAVLLSEGTVITQDDLLAAVENGEEVFSAAEAYKEQHTEAGIYKQLRSPERADETRKAAGSLVEMEQETIDRVLREENFNYGRAAARLGIHRTTLWRRLRRRSD